MNYLLALTLTIAVPPLGIIMGLAGLYSNFRNWKIYVFCISLGLASIAYCYYPKGDPDIVRYVEYIMSLEGTSLNEVLATGFRGESYTIFFSLFCWIAAQMKDPQIIPALSTFFVYYCGLSVTCKLAEDMDVKRKTFIAYILFVLLSLNLYSIINNVRNVFAFSIVSYAFFRDLYLHKRNIPTWIMYTFPILVHPSAVVLLLVRLAIGFTSKMRAVMIVGVIFLQTIISTAYQIAQRINPNNYIINLLRTVVIRADSYYNDTSSEWGLQVQKSIVFRTERIINIFFAVLIVLLLIHLYRRESKKVITMNKPTKFLMDYSFVLSLLTISCLPMLTPEYWRFYSITVLFSAVVYFAISKYGSNNARLLAKLIFLVTPVETAIWVTRIAYSDVAVLLLKPFISSPIIVLTNSILSQW